MTRPLPNPSLPLRFPWPDRGTRTEEDTFGVSSPEIEEIVTSWRANGIAIHAIDTGALGVRTIGDAHGASSRVARALRDTADPARRAVESIGHRLTTMGELLDTFVSTTLATDSRSASKFDSLRER